MFKFKSDDKKPPPAYSPPAPTSSSAPPATQLLPVNYACVLLSRCDRIRILGFPQDVVGPLDVAIARVWLSGVQSKGPYHGGGCEWKLTGYPWSGAGHEAVPSRRLMCHILSTLQEIGWQLVCTSDLSKKSTDKDTLFFKPAPPVYRYFFSVSFNEQDKIRIIDSPSPAVTTAFIAAVSTWALGVQSQREKEQGCFQIKLRGTPWWSSDGVQVNHARFLACNVLSAMESHGFDFVASIDMSAGRGDDHRDLDSWFFATRIPRPSAYP